MGGGLRLFRARSLQGIRTRQVAVTSRHLSKASLQGIVVRTSNLHSGVRFAHDLSRASEHDRWLSVERTSDEQCPISSDCHRSSYGQVTSERRHWLRSSFRRPFRARSLQGIRTRQVAVGRAGAMRMDNLREKTLVSRGITKHYPWIRSLSCNEQLQQSNA